MPAEQDYRECIKTAWVIPFARSGLVLAVMLLLAAAASLAVLSVLLPVWLFPGRVVQEGYGHAVDDDLLRWAAHRVLRNPPGNYHDAFTVLRRLGNEKSVPYLIESLRYCPAFDTTKPPTATWGQCQEALYRITGFSLGYRHTVWQSWWNRYRQHHRPRWIWDSLLSSGFELDPGNDAATVAVLLEAVGRILNKDEYFPGHVFVLLTGRYPRPKLDKLLALYTMSANRYVRTGILVMRYKMCDLGAVRGFFSDPEQTLVEAARGYARRLLAGTSPDRKRPGKGCRP